MVVLINACDLAIQALLLEFIVLFISLPDDGLFVIEGLLGLLAALLLLHLAAKQVAHLLLLHAVTLHASLVFQARPHFFLLLETQQGLLFIADTILLFGDNVAGERVHEVLGAGLASTELTQTIRLLLIKHLTVLELRLHICLDFSLPLIVGVHLVGLVLSEHFLEVLLFLASLFHLELALHFHLLLETVDHLDLLAERVLVFIALACLLFAQLSVATLLLLLYLLPLSVKLLLLTLPKELHVLLLESLIHSTLL